MKHLVKALAVLAFPLAFAFSALPAAAATAVSATTGGQELYTGLQNGTLTCTQLTDDNFDSLGDFYAGRMLGSSADIMNQRMADRLGGDAEKQMHVAMGKRLSGCDTNAAYPTTNLSAAGWMMGGTMMGSNWGGMGDWGTYGAENWILSALFWVVVIGAVAALVMWMVRSSSHGSGAKSGSALDILDECYAKGEIDKDEYDQKRKDLKK